MARAKTIGPLASRVGRRIFVLFAFAGLLPALLTAYLSYREATDNAEQSVYQRLREDAESYGLMVLGNFQGYARSARSVTGTWRLFDGDLRGAQVRAMEDFDAIWQINPDGSLEPVYGLGPSELDPALFSVRHLEMGRAQLFLVPAEHLADPVLVVAIDPTAPARGWLAFRLPADAPWTPHDYAQPYHRHCVLTVEGAPLLCSPKEANALGNAFGPKSSLEPIAWSRDGGDRMSAPWQLFLHGEFAHEPINIVTTVNREHALQGVATPRDFLPPVLIFAGVLVTILSLGFTRRNVIPLEKMTAALRRIAEGGLGTRVDIHTGDEFETLGEAFNDMTEQLGAQLATLRTMSEIDRLVMSTTPTDQVCIVFLERLSAMAGSEVCAVILRTGEDDERGTYLLNSGGELYSGPVDLPDASHDDPPVGDDDGWTTADVPAPLRTHFEQRGVERVTQASIASGEQHYGFVLIGSTASSLSAAQAASHCRDLAGRLAIGLASAERERALYHQAHFDELTGLPNRKLLNDELSKMLERSTDGTRAGALLFVDLDRFKEINDVYGHSIGDDVLRDAAGRMQRAAHDADFVARHGGDEFVVVARRAANNERAAALARRLRQALVAPFEVDGKDHVIDASVGIVFFPDDGDNTDVLIRNADAAMYRAKDAGRGRYEFFSEQLSEANRRRMTVERELRRAVEGDALEVHYQPQFDLGDGSLRGAEALLRWDHPELGSIPPVEFITVAEGSSLIVEVGQWVLDRVCADLRQHLDAGVQPGTVSVNVSARQLRHHGFLSGILETLERHGVEGHHIELEITESVLASNRETAADTLATLRSHGLKIALDDFGTGYSSMTYLQHLPFDVLKIDQSFVRPLGEAEDTESICRAIITMAHEVGKQVIAEGVETTAHESFLRRHRCEFVQGFLYSKPLSRDEFVEFIAGQPWHAQRRLALRVL